MLANTGHDFALAAMYRIVRGDPSLASCIACKRIFHQICLSFTAPGSPLACAGCSAPPNAVSSAARARKASADALPNRSRLRPTQRRTRPRPQPINTPQRRMLLQHTLIEGALCQSYGRYGWNGPRRWITRPLQRASS